jgi:hypothetical protein
MEALTSTALRCVVQEQGKLPDVILPLLQEYQVNDNSDPRRRLPILRKYPNFYKNGYLPFGEISDPDDLGAFARYIKGNAKKNSGFKRNG